MHLSELSRALHILGQVDPHAFPLHHAQILCLISEKGSVTYADIEESLGLSNAGISRSLNTLSDSVRHRKKCFGLVEIYRDPDEGRRYRVRLTAKGLALFRTIEAC